MIDNGQINVRLIREEDTPKVCEIMEEAKASFAGLSSKSIFSAICRDGVYVDNMIIVVATIGAEIVGYGVAVIDHRKYWRRFFFRYPAITARIAVTRLFGALKGMVKEIFRMKKKQSKTNEECYKQLVNVVPTDRSWKESSAEIAKNYHAGVKVSAQGKSIGKSLVLHRIEILKQRGVSRLDSKIPCHNISAIRMMSKFGWTFSKQGTSLFLTMDFDQGEESDNR